MSLSQFNRFAMVMTLFAAIGGILYGYDVGIISGAFLFVHHDIHMSSFEMEWMVGAVFWGGAVATLVTGFLCDLIGRRKMIIISSICFVIGVLMVSLAHAYMTLLLGRLIQGVGVGVVTIVVPLYLAESVPTHIRGRAVSCFQLLLTLGILLASLIGLFFTPTGNWRGMFLSSLVPGVLLFLGGLCLPDSPRWLCLKGRYDKALAVLCKSRHQKDAFQELEQIKSAIVRGHEDKGHNPISIWKKRFIVPFIIVLCAACLQQLTGVNSILQLSAVILKQGGLSSNVVAMLGSSAITGLNFVVTMVAILLVDKMGRKFLLSVGTGGACIALFLAGVVSFSMVTGVDKGHFLLGTILAFVFFFAMGPGIVIWLVISELLPSPIRSVGMAIALFINSGVSAAFSTAFLGLVHKIHYSGTFWICAATTLLYFLLAFFVIPETKGKSLEEVEQLFVKGGQ